jgi:hypothetical protein
MISLETQLSTMSFEEEISKFNERNSPTTINIKPEYVFHDIVDFILTFFLEDIYNNFFDRLNLELFFALEIRCTDFFEFAPKRIS